jgi:hypothetical protein
MTGAFVGATVVALLQYVRSRDRRLILLMAMFLLQAFSMTREWFDAWKDISLGLMCLAGLALVLTFGPDRSSRPPGGASPRAE